MSNKVFDVRVVEPQAAHYEPAYVEVRYNDGVQTTTYRLSPGSVYLLVEQLQGAATEAGELHRAACQRGEEWYAERVRAEREGKQ